MSDLPKRLRIKAGVMNMGERIAWGSDTALMEEAAKLIEQQQAEIDALKAQLKERDEIIEAVAHIGVDFGYGSYELEEKHIDKARELLVEKENN